MVPRRRGLPVPCRTWQGGDRRAFLQDAGAFPRRDSGASRFDMALRKSSLRRARTPALQTADADAEHRAIASCKSPYSASLRHSRRLCHASPGCAFSSGLPPGWLESVPHRRTDGHGPFAMVGEGEVSPGPAADAGRFAERKRTNGCAAGRHGQGGPRHLLPAGTDLRRHPQAQVVRLCRQAGQPQEELKMKSLLCLCCMAVWAAPSFADSAWTVVHETDEFDEPTGRKNVTSTTPPCSMDNGTRVAALAKGKEKSLGGLVCHARTSIWRGATTTHGPAQ